MIDFIGRKGEAENPFGEGKAAANYGSAVIALVLLLRLNVV
jgi:hypothetical protein